MTTRSIMGGTLGLPVGGWRWAAVFFFLVALAASALAVITPQAAQWAGVALLAGIGTVASFAAYAVWPRDVISAADARRTAEAAARANVAWAVTGIDGAVLDCNDVYRRMSGADADEAPPPPELALAGEMSSSVLYRLTRSAADRLAREESFSVAPGLEIVAAVRPISGGQNCWWFTPRLSAETHATPPTQTGAVDCLEALREAPIGIAMADSQGRLTETNTLFRSFFGATGSLTGKAVDELIALADRQAVRDLIAATVDGKMDVSAGKRTEVRPFDEADGRMAELFTGPMSDGRVLLYLQDVTEQKALETKFAQSQKLQAVGQLAGGVAHDFNNHLTVIIGNCEFLLMRHHAGDPSFKEINEVNQHALRAANLVKQLLAFSRKQTLQPKVLALKSVVGELAIMLRRLLREGVELKLEHVQEVWPVHADETQISNAIINLVVNARDAMPKGGTVSIRITNESVVDTLTVGASVLPSGDYVAIAVADTGVGIAKEHLTKIFDPFFTTKPVGQGTGLGLATVYGIVKQTGGYITVESVVGKGTTFRIFLPRHSDVTAQPEKAETDAAPVGRDITGQDTILLVEDEEAVRSFAARALRMRGYQVLEAGGGEEALEIIRKAVTPIHLLITDVVMPNMDGPTLVRNVRRIRPDLSVIFMSGYAEDAFQRNDEKAEELYFLPKPFGLKQLAAKVKEVLSETAAKGH